MALANQVVARLRWCIRCSHDAITQPMPKVHNTPRAMAHPIFKISKPTCGVK